MIGGRILVIFVVTWGVWAKFYFRSVRPNNDPEIHYVIVLTCMM